MTINVVESAGCRFWGYQPESATLHFTKREEQAAKLKADVAAMKAAGFKSAYRYGLNTRAAAVMAAGRASKASGVKLYVFSHDYL